MQRTDGDETNSSAQPAQPAEGVQVYQGRPTETLGSGGGTGEVSYEVSCCGFCWSSSFDLASLVKPFAE
jgi:hypothetical protein